MKALIALAITSMLCITACTSTSTSVVSDVARATIPPNTTSTPEATAIPNTPTVTAIPTKTASIENLPREFKVDDFAKDYYGVVHIDKSDGFSNEGWIAIYDKTSDHELIKVKSSSFFLDLHQEKIKANISQLPYGEQSLIVYDDFNFDGIADFAIQDGLRSCYGLPSFYIYLAQNGKFVLNDEFSKLAHEQCGMFNVDKAHQRIYTMMKSGCCWHLYSEYAVVNNIPIIKKTTEDDGQYLPFRKVSTYEGGNETAAKTELYLFEGFVDHRNLILSFELEGNTGEQVILFQEILQNEPILRFVLVAKDKKIKIYSLPKDPKDAPAIFSFTKEPSKLSIKFADGNTQYKVYETKSGNVVTSIGLTITTNGKSVVSKGNIATIQNDLSFIEQFYLDNVTVKK